MTAPHQVESDKNPAFCQKGCITTNKAIMLWLQITVWSWVPQEAQCQDRRTDRLTISCNITWKISQNVMHTSSLNSFIYVNNATQNGIHKAHYLLKHSLITA